MLVERKTKRFEDRHAAGRALARHLLHVRAEHPVVVGLARGGLPVASEIARALDAPLDVLIVRKVGAPGNPEFGIGAVAEGGVRVLNRDSLRMLMVSVEELEHAVARAQAEAETRVERYRHGRAPLDVTGRTVIIVDDGLATGGTARAAVRALRARGARRVVLAVPVGAPETVASLRHEVDEVICLLEPEAMWAVGLYYENFGATSDDEVEQLLGNDVDDPPAPIPVSPGAREVRIPVAEIVGDLVVPAAARGLVVFAHGSGSSRFSPRNRQVATVLNERGLATLLIDLLRWEEERDRTNVFDIELLSARLVSATRWLTGQPGLCGLPIGYFGASTGAGAALAAAATLPDTVHAVVSRGGRPDLAAHWLASVSAPVLLIVGSRDRVVLELNREARELLSGSSELAIVEGATHLFEEPGALAEVARLAGDWFERCLTGSRETP